jgi:hypothetical protein
MVKEINKIRKIIAWTPFIGAISEMGITIITRNADYLVDLTHTGRFMLAAVWHGIGFAGILILYVKLTF